MTSRWIWQIQSLSLRPKVPQDLLGPELRNQTGGGSKESQLGSGAGDQSHGWQGWAHHGHHCTKAESSACPGPLPRLQCQRPGPRKRDCAI